MVGHATPPLFAEARALIAIAGAGAFGTALALVLARIGADVALWTRDPAAARAMAQTRENPRYLPGARFPDGIAVGADAALLDAPVVLLAIPMRGLPGFLADHSGLLEGRALVACAKGVDLETGVGPAGLVARACPGATVALLSGPSFAADLAAGLPTALTLACREDAAGEHLQGLLSTPALRLYRTDDVTGVELGGALKNVVALAAGLTLGAGFGESARAAVMTRGFAEMQRFAVAAGARAETLAGLSGFGDLALTCTSAKSRNFAAGLALGRGEPMPAGTVEGAGTAAAVARLAPRQGVPMPLTETVAEVLAGRLSVADAAERLLTRPLRPE